MSQRGEEVERQRREGPQRRGTWESTLRDDRWEAALHQRRESTPSPEAGNERTRGTSRNSAVIDRVDRIIPFPLRRNHPSQDRRYRDDISDGEVDGDNGSTAPSDGLVPWEDEYQTSNLNVPSHLLSGPSPTLGATRGHNSSVAPGDAPAPRGTEYQTSNLDVPSTLPSVWTEYTARVTTHSNNSAYECAYIVRNMSRVNDEIAMNQCQIDQLRYRPPHLRSVVSWMKDCLDNAKVDSIHQDLPRAFIPCTRLYAIMNEGAVQRALEELVGDDQTPTSRVEIKRLTQMIAPSIHDLTQAEEGTAQFRRVFAVLIMIRKADCIFGFVRDGVDDTYMCNRAVAFEMPEGEDDEELQKAYAKFPEPFQDRTSWLKQDVREFRDKRWEVSPPFFLVNGPQGGDSATRTSQPGQHKPALIHYELRSSDVILPFLKEKRQPATNGAFSQLEFYRLHEDQHEGRRYTIHQKKHPIAVKRLEDKRESNHPRDLTKKFQSERYVLQRLTLGGKSEHLVKLLATFETLGENCPTKYHFIFEAADGTIGTLWNHESIWNDANKAALSMWAAHQCHGLAEALAQFHKFQRLAGDRDPKTRGMHGDIKPDNILWCRDWDVRGGENGASGAQAAGEEPLGILQIADFGLSSFHSTGTVFDVKIITANDYTAPETERWLRHPPPSDVWALGCLFLDFATWLVGGPSGYEEFTEARMTRGPLFKKRRRFSTFAQVRRNMVEVALSRKVLEHATRLHRSQKASPFVRELIALVLDHMLVVEPLWSVTRRSDRRREGGARRMASGKVRDVLERMMEHGRRHPAYHVPSKMETDFRNPSRPVLSFEMTAERLREDILNTHGEVRAEIAAEEG